MSKGPGRVERAIRDLLAASPDLAFITDELAEHCYGLNQDQLERKHRVAVLRAAHKAVAGHPDWVAWRIEGQGRGWVFVNLANAQSYALGRLIGDQFNAYRSPRRSARRWSRNRPVHSRAELLAQLAPGGKEHKLVTPGGAWARHVEEHTAKRDGTPEQVAAIEARERTELAARARAMKAIFAGRRPPPPGQPDAHQHLAGVLDTVRRLPDENDPDAARARVEEIARALEGVLEA